MRVRLLRALCFGGERKEAGSEMEIEDRYLVRELLFSGRAEEVGERSPPPSGPMTSDSVPMLVKGKQARKGVQDAGK